MKKSILVFVLGLIISVSADAQQIQNPLKIGVGFFGTSYSGDLSNGEGNFRISPGANIALQFASTKLISPQLNVGFGKFFAQDRDISAVEGIQPNRFVETSFFYIDFRLRAMFLRQKRVNPYLSLGVGLLGYSPKDENGNSLVDNLDTRQEGETYGSMTASFPMSLGTEFKMSDVLALGLEYTYRLTSSDFLDNVSALGTVDGKDKMHTFMVTLFFTIKP